MKIEKFTTGQLMTNSYILSNDKKECIIIDPGLMYKNVSNYINNNYKVLAILLTHGHFDHIDGISYFLNTPIYLYKDEKEVFDDFDKNLYYMLDRISPFKCDDLNINYLNDLDTFQISDFFIKVIHTPGHTIGSCCYLINDNLFTGDTLFKLSVGRWDFPTGNYDTLIESLKKLKNMFNCNINCYPGHNDETTLDYEKKYNSFLK